MKNRKFFFTVFLMYFFLYNIIFEIITSLFNTEADVSILNPPGRLFRKMVLNEDIDCYRISEIIVLLYNFLFVSSIFFISVYKWLFDYNFFKALFKLMFAFILTSILTWCIITWDGIGMLTIAAFIIYYVFPLLTMAILTFPFFWVINKVEWLNDIKDE